MYTNWIEFLYQSAQRASERMPANDRQGIPSEAYMKTGHNTIIDDNNVDDVGDDN